jgi:septum formation protein
MSAEMPPQSGPLILASSSRYRRELLARFGRAFEVVVPDIDESPLPGESAAALVERLALAKARRVADQRPDAVVVGSDQVAVLDGRIFGKPGTRERAIEQLSQCSGRSVRFLTAVCVLGPRGRIAGCDTVVTDVSFRSLQPGEISRYLDLEPALNCAGSFQSEGLGASLCTSMRSEDPSALVGLPLIALRRLLVQAGIAIP